MLLSESLPRKVAPKKDTIRVYYLPEKLKHGPTDGYAPLPIAIERSVELPVLSEHLQQLEQQLNALLYTHPQGDQYIRFANDAKWRKVLIASWSIEDTAESCYWG